MKPNRHIVTDGTDIPQEVPNSKLPQKPKNTTHTPDMKWMPNIPSRGIKLTNAEIREATVSGGERSFRQIGSIRKNIKNKEKINQSLKVVSDKKLLNKFKNAKIEMASTDDVSKYQKEIRIILKMLGHPEALVSDESSVWDFLSHFGDEKENKEFNKNTLERISCRLALDVKARDLLVDIAKRIREQ